MNHIEPRCWVCGGTPEQCGCEGGFIDCECSGNGDITDPSYCPVHGPGGLYDRSADAQLVEAA